MLREGKMRLKVDDEAPKPCGHEPSPSDSFAILRKCQCGHTDFIEIDEFFGVFDKADKEDDHG